MLAGGGGHGIDGPADQGAGGPDELGVLAAGGMDAEPAPVEPRRNLVGVEPGRVHHRARPDGLGRRADLDAGGVGAAGDEGAARQQDDLAARRVVPQRADEGLGVDDAGRRRPEGGAGRHVRLHPADGGGIDDLQVGDAVGLASRAQALQLGPRFLGAGDDQLSAAPVRYFVPGAEPVERLAALDAEPGLEGAGRIVDARVDDAAVVGAGLGAEAGMALDQADGAPGAGGLSRARQADDAASDHDQIDRFHRARGMSTARCMSRSIPTTTRSLPSCAAPRSHGLRRRDAGVAPPALDGRRDPRPACPAIAGPPRAIPYHDVDRAGPPSYDWVRGRARAPHRRHHQG